MLRRSPLNQVSKECKRSFLNYLKLYFSKDHFFAFETYINLYAYVFNVYLFGNEFNIMLDFPFYNTDYSDSFDQNKYRWFNIIKNGICRIGFYRLDYFMFGIHFITSHTQNVIASLRIDLLFFVIEFQFRRARPISEEEEQAVETWLEAMKQNGGIHDIVTSTP
jgi:hypothetical protein